MCLVIPEDSEHLRFGAIESFIIGLILGILVVGVPSFTFYLYLQKSEPVNSPKPSSLLQTIEAETTCSVCGVELCA